MFGIFKMKRQLLVGGHLPTISFYGSQGYLLKGIVRVEDNDFTNLLVWQQLNGVYRRQTCQCSGTPILS